MRTCSNAVSHGCSPTLRSFLLRQPTVRYLYSLSPRRVPLQHSTNVPSLEYDVLSEKLNGTQSLIKDSVDDTKRDLQKLEERLKAHIDQQIDVLKQHLDDRIETVKDNIRVGVAIVMVLCFFILYNLSVTRNHHLLRARFHQQHQHYYQLENNTPQDADMQSRGKNWLSGLWHGLFGR